VAGQSASYPACAPGGESKDSPSSLLTRESGFGIRDYYLGLLRTLIVPIVLTTLGGRE